MIACPEPSAPSEADTAYRAGLRSGYLSELYQGECDVFWSGHWDGQLWRIRWGLYTDVTGTYIGSKLTRAEAERVTKGLGISFRPIPY